jgi:hypothetical protein
VNLSCVRPGLTMAACRAGPACVATPSEPSTLALTIAKRAGVLRVGRAVSGQPQFHRDDR